MRQLRRWTVAVFVGEGEGFTYAEAALQDLGHRLLSTASDDLAAVIHAPVVLDR
jgi:hypothetical protein